MNNVNSFADYQSVSTIPANLLIVDDEPLNRQILRSIFEAEHFNVIEAENGLQALRIAIEERPDLIILDIMMPGLNGYEVCASLQANEATNTIPVVMVTSLQSSEEETRGLESGAVDFIVKPINPTIVVARVQAHLQLKRNKDILAHNAAKLVLANRLLEQEIEDHFKTEESLRSARDEVATANMVKDGLIRDLFQAMCEMLSSRDLYTFEHGLRVASIARLIGEDLGLSDRKLEALELGCMLHDISKVAIPDDVLLKPGVFDSQDREIMRLHPSLGAKIFRRRSCDPLIIDIIHQHHERLDGSGYPRGLPGKELGLLPRIAMVADTYEALVSSRPYKKPMKREAAIAVLREEAGAGRLDQELVDCLVKVTLNWNSLEIGAGQDFSDENTKALEVFRKKTYFKEPLSDFYNYRYLFFLEESGLLDISTNGFTLIKVSFADLQQCNQRFGYLKTDQIIDEAGTLFFNVLERMDAREAADCTNILLKKESSYLIFSNCTSTVVDLLLAGIREETELVDESWGLESAITHLKFPKDHAMEKAVSELLGAV